MSKRSKYTVEKKLEIINMYYEGNYSIQSIIYKYDIDKETLKHWMKKFERYGAESLKESNTWKKYSKELKHAAVKDYLTGNYSLRDIIYKHEISDTSVLRQWINKYNGHRELKDTYGGRKSTMTKGRNTTVKERIEITEYCLANDHNYRKTAIKYNVSYQQVYTWVRKYKELGVEGLQDKRGKRNIKKNLTPEELMDLKFKKLEAENERLRAENLLLKKLKELEGRRF